jgi:alanine racemase
MKRASEKAADRRPTVATIHLSAVRANFAEAERRADGSAVIAVVKADAYGHGAAPVARALVDAGCRRFAVFNVSEGVALRDAGIGLPILVLGGVHTPSEAEEAVARSLTPVVHHAGHVQWLSAVARNRGGVVAVHVEVDSGMRRMGVPAGDALGLLEAIHAGELLALEGVHSHFACADEADPAPSVEQVAVFRKVLAAARAGGIAPEFVHMANSAALIAGARVCGALTEANAVRPGLMLYGVHPGEHHNASLEPAMTLRSCVVNLRSVRSGESVGYAASYRPRRDTTVATVPVGYADGIPVALGNRGSVLIAGALHPMVGRVSMDLITVDIGDASVRIGDEVILFGPDEGGAVLPVEAVAAEAGTIPYELLVRVGPRVPRQYRE